MVLGGSDVHSAGPYRGTSLMKKAPLLRPCSRTTPTALWWSKVGGLFRMSEVPLYGRTCIGTWSGFLEGESGPLGVTSARVVHLA